MSDSGFFLSFLLIIVVLAVMGYNNDSKDMSRTFSSDSTSTTAQTSHTTTQHSWETPSLEAPRETTQIQTLSPSQVEARVASIYRDLDTLKEDIRKAKLWSPVSPYKGTVSLRAGNVYDENPDREYLILSMAANVTTTIDISKWYVRSYVTGEVGLIPNGDRILENWQNPEEEPIVLRQGEAAYLITGKSPISGSFKENACIGYLAKEETFFPSLSQSCPYPREELKRFGANIDLDNDKCYAFVDSLASCTEPDEETYTRSKVGGACRDFIEDTFTYKDCVRLHRYDPYFSRESAYWHIYLDERYELWRPRREIIQLIDGNDRIVDVIEY